MKNVLVLGGTGFVGAHVCEKLVRAGASVTVPTRRRNNARKLLHLPTLTVLELDVHDAAVLRQVMAGHDAVVNCVAILHGSAAQFERTHVALANSVAQAAVANRVAQLVHISALGVSPDAPQTAPSKYLRSKSLGELAIAQAQGQVLGTTHGQGVQVSVLRPSVIFGAEDKFLNTFADLQALLPLVPLAGAAARLQPVWVEDVAAAIVACVSGPHAAASIGQSYEAFGPDIYTLAELVGLAGRISGAAGGRGRPVFALPDALARIQARLMELMPGEPLLSRDNLDSLSVPNVATGLHPGLQGLGITPAALMAIAPSYLGHRGGRSGLMALRQGR